MEYWLSFLAYEKQYHVFRKRPDQGRFTRSALRELGGREGNTRAVYLECTTKETGSRRGWRNEGDGETKGMEESDLTENVWEVQS